MAQDFASIRCGLRPTNDATTPSRPLNLLRLKTRPQTGNEDAGPHLS